MKLTGRTTRFAVSALAIPAVSALAPTPAAAQDIGSQGVAARARPDYDPIGIDTGGITLFPAITASIEATDNYRALPTNEQGAVYATLQPEIYARSDWNRHRLEARAYAAQSFNFSLPSENVTQFGTSATGIYDVSRRTSLRGDITAARFAENRQSLGAFRGTAEPVRYDLIRSGLGASQGFNDITLTATASVERRDFKDVRLRRNAGKVDQDFRDVRLLNVGGSVEYDLRNGIGLIVSGQYDQAKYDFGPGSAGFIPGTSLNRNSSGFSLQGGVTLELTRLIFGTIQVGYLQRDYRDPRLNDSNGLSYSADILWNVTQLTSIRARASRSIEESSAFEFAGNRRSDYRLSVDHELYRNVLLNADAGYATFKPNGVGFGGREYTVGAGARWLINRRFTLSGGARYSGRDSRSPFLRFNALSANVALRFAL